MTKKKSTERITHLGQKHILGYIEKKSYYKMFNVLDGAEAIDMIGEDMGKLQKAENTE